MRARPPSLWSRRLPQAAHRLTWRLSHQLRVTWNQVSPLPLRRCPIRHVPSSRRIARRRGGCRANGPRPTHRPLSRRQSPLRRQIQRLQPSPRWRPGVDRAAHLFRSRPTPARSRPRLLSPPSLPLRSGPRRLSPPQLRTPPWRSRRPAHRLGHRLAGHLDRPRASRCLSRPPHLWLNRVGQKYPGRRLSPAASGRTACPLRLRRPSPRAR